MEYSIILAKLFGLYLVIIGIALLVQRENLLKALQEISKSSAQLLIVAIIPLMLGLILVVTHNVWVAGWQVVITILAWLVLLKGLFRLFLPQVCQKVLASFGSPGCYYSLTVISILVGVYLLYFGFWA